MRRINIRQAVGEPILAAPLVDERGAYVLAAGKPLTSSLARRIWERGFRHAYVEAPGFEDVAAEEPLQPRTYSRLRRLQTDVLAAVRQTRPGDTPELPTAELTELTAEACDELAALPAERAFLLYPPWASRQDEWISFSINAAVLAALLGLDEGVADVRHLFMAALLQDIGLWRADRPQDHVTAAVDLLRPVRGLSPIVKALVAEHHELLDGSGYPAGTAGDELHRLTPFMSVAVAYLEMLGSSTNPVLPHEAMEALLAGVDAVYAGGAVKRFRNIVYAYPPGTTVRLTDGRRGVVIDPGPAGLHRPRVRILPTSGGRVGAVAVGDLSSQEAEEEYPVVDLATQLSLMIERVLE